MVIHEKNEKVYSEKWEPINERKIKVNRFFYKYKLTFMGFYAVKEDTSLAKKMNSFYDFMKKQQRLTNQRNYYCSKISFVEVNT